MLLRNYDNIMAVYQSASILGSNVGDKSQFGDGFVNMKDVNGTIYTISTNSPGSPNYTVPPFTFFVEGDNTLTTSERTTKLICGSGDRAVTYDDYCLDNCLPNSQVKTVPQTQKIERTVNVENNTLVTKYSKTLIATQDIVIKEIGVVSCHNSDTNYSSDRSILVYREVLDKSISVVANSSFVLSFSTIVSLNSNKPVDYQASVSVE